MLSWTDFCQDPKRTGSCPQKSSETDPQHTWNTHYQFPIHWAFHGWWGWHVDYIIRTDRFLEQGIREVSSRINDKAKLRGEPLRSRNQARTVNKQKNMQPLSRNIDEKTKICKYYTGKNAICAKAIEYTMDPCVLGYENFCSDFSSNTTLLDKF